MGGGEPSATPTSQPVTNVLAALYTLKIIKGLKVKVTIFLARSLVVLQKYWERGLVTCM